MRVCTNRVGDVGYLRRASRTVVAYLLIAAGSPLGVRLALAQSPAAQALFLETVRDPGNPDVPPTARSLALGGTRSVSGLADDLTASPATLLLSTGTDLVASGGALFYARDELLDTPDRFPPRLPARARTGFSSTLPVYVAAATRGRRWAAGAFFDASAVFDHQFETATSNIYFAALQGTFVSEDGTGSASLSQRVARLGGALSVGTSSLSVGMALSAIRLDYQVSAHVHVDGESAAAGGPVMRFTQEHETRARFLGWAPGLVVSAMVRPIPHVVVSGRWERNPEFVSTRTALMEDEGNSSRSDTAIRFQLPSTYAVSGSVTSGRTIITGEVARTRFSQAFRPMLRTTGVACGTPNANCQGWGFANYEAADATAWRAGVEQGIPLANGTFLLRGGFAHQGAYTVARPTSDPLRNGGSLPAPPFLSDYEPPRSAATWISGGVAYRWRAYELGVGLGRSGTGTRVLADFRILH